MIKSTIALLGLIFGVVLALFAGYQMLAFTFAFVLIAALPYLFSSKNIDIFDPHLTLSVLLYLYSVSTLAYVSNYGQTYYSETVTSGEMTTYQLCCILGMIGFSAGKIFSNTVFPVINRQSLSYQAYYDRARSVITGIGVFCFLAFIYFIKDKFTFWAATSYADMALAVRVSSLEDQAAGIKEIATQTVPLFFILGTCIALALAKNRPLSMHRIVAASVLLAYLSTMLLSGWRSQMMSVMVMIAVYYHYTCKKLSVRFVLIGAVFVYILINFLSIMRGSSNPIEMIGLLMEAFTERGMDILAISQSGELATSTNLIRLISGINHNEIDFGYGSIAVDQIVALVPRAVMPDRPPIASERFVQTFYPGIYESGGGYGFFILQDGYWDFGLIGVLIYSFGFAILTQKIYRSFLGRAGHPFWTLFYGLMYYNLIFSSIRSGIFASIKSTLIVAAPVMLIYLFTEMYINGKKAIRKKP